MLLESLEENRPCTELKVARGRKANFGKEGKCLLLLRLWLLRTKKSRVFRKGLTHLYPTSKPSLAYLYKQSETQTPRSGLPCAGPAYMFKPYPALPRYLAAYPGYKAVHDPQAH